MQCKSLGSIMPSISIKESGTFHKANKLLTHNDTFADRLIRKGKDHRILAILFVFALLLIFLASVTDAVDKLWNFAETRFGITTVPPQPSSQNTTPQKSFIPTDTVSQLSIAEDNNHIISKLLSDALEHIEALRLTTPAGDNAFEIYQEILLIEPENPSALEGLSQIAVTYLSLADSAVVKSEYATAELYIEKAKSINSNVENLQETEGLLADARDNTASSKNYADSENERQNLIASSTETKVSTNEKKQAANTIGLEQHITLLENSASNAPTNSNCTDSQALTLALAAAADTFSSTKRDAAYLKIVDSALCQPNFDIATRAADSMFSSTNQDEAFLEIVKTAIIEKQYNVANEVAGKMFSSTRKDHAKRLVIDAITN